MQITKCIAAVVTGGASGLGRALAEAGAGVSILDLNEEADDAVSRRVNAIMPNIFDSPPMLAMEYRAPEMFDNLGASVPFPKRMGGPEVFRSLALELVRDSCSNGQNLRIDGAIRMLPR